VIGSFIYFSCTRALPFSFNKIIIHKKKKDLIVATDILINLSIFYNIFLLLVLMI
jgi:hypothetical protein